MERGTKSDSCPCILRASGLCAPDLSPLPLLQTVCAAGARPKVKKCVLAYSGGLDTSVILKWLQDAYDCEVVTFTADLGQVKRNPLHAPMPARRTASSAPLAAG